MRSGILLSLFLIVSTIQNSFSFLPPTESKQVLEQCSDINHAWMDMSLVLTKNCVGFSAPVAARALCYVSIANYEGSVEFIDNAKSLSDQISGYQRNTWNNSTKPVYFPIVLNQINFKTVSFLYRNMPPENRRHVIALYDSINTIVNKGVSKKVIQNSNEYANRLTNEIIEFSKKDGGHKGFARNFPASYKFKNCKSCWSRTPPGYQTALLPSWGNNKTLVKNNNQQCNDIPLLTFSEEQDSEFYHEANAINELFLNKNKTHEIIAEYWDDSPGYSGSPVGHFFSIAKELAVIQKIELKELVSMYALLGLAINDAVIESWRLKYLHNLIRPVTYIQNYINPNFNTVLNTPPFPEFPSGHSFQSGSGTEILKHFFSDTLEFTDHTNADRTDIIGTPRTYKSFTEMSEEMSLSRFYGGIHYLKTLNISLTYGRKIGKNTLANIKLEK